MIEKELVTTKTEVWRDPEHKHRYVFRRQWSIGAKEDKEGPMAAVITIRPTDTEPFTNDLSMMLIEKNVRQLGFTGFIAVNLFSSVNAKNKTTFKSGIDENTMETIATVLNEKRVSQIIFACGSITGTNQMAYEQAKIIYENMSAKQKKLVKVLVDPSSGKVSHPLNVHVRNGWVLSEADVLFTDK